MSGGETVVETRNSINHNYDYCNNDSYHRGNCRLTSADVVRHALVQEIINAYEKAAKKPDIKKPSRQFSGNYKRKT